MWHFVGRISQCERAAGPRHGRIEDLNEEVKLGRERGIAFWCLDRHAASGRAAGACVAALAPCHGQVYRHYARPASAPAPASASAPAPASAPASTSAPWAGPFGRMRLPIFEKKM